MNEDQQYLYDAVEALMNKSIYSIFVETGTAIGDTALWASDLFKQVYTIEYDYEAYTGAMLKFCTIPNMTLIHGDSAQWTADLAYRIVTPAIWWLDAHAVDWEDDSGYAPSGETPVLTEITNVLYHAESSLTPGSKHAILMDDAELFGTRLAYPTLGEVADVADRYGYTMTADEKVITLT